VPKELLGHILSSYIKTVHTENFHGWSLSLPVFDRRQPENTQNLALKMNGCHTHGTKCVLVQNGMFSPSLSLKLFTDRFQ